MLIILPSFFLNILVFLIYTCNLRKKLHKKIIKQINIYKTQIEIKTIKKKLENLINIFKNNTLLQYKILVDIIVYDIPGKIKRFAIIYNLLSISYNIYLFIKILITENETLISLDKFYKASNWIEREIWDLFGIFFFKHKNLRKILSDYCFEWFPLRKDFPLTGFKEIFFNNNLRHIIYEKIELCQELRGFIGFNFWNY